MRRFGWAWNELGETNALGAILTKDGRIGEWTLPEFFETGVGDAAHFMEGLDQIARVNRRMALDFGCGVGRITRALGTYFETVVGLDVAPSMIERARTLNADCPNCTFVLNRAPNLRQFADGTFDVIFSRIVLQHIRPAIVRRYIPEFVRVLAPGGVLMFQLPEVMSTDSRQLFEDAPVIGSSLKRRLPRSLVVAWRRLKYFLLVRSSGAQIEMFGMPRAEVEALIREAGGRLVETTPDHSHGDVGDGWAYWVTR
jgi:ubiquinone/menaquinone biosynthesis C-methylase UbiE